ncbi:MAG: EVE domain-containing protein [Actinobacteria bacterium]|nr:EVE domain-containing protein [Actinomycetota bacterium]NBY56772.1 EVE domain-containing protein [Actinomycetota bacterium]
MTTWIFQSDPERFDLLADWEEGDVGSWSANQKPQEMRNGDRVVFRISGKSAGLYGVGEIVSECYEAPNEFGSWKVDVRYDYLIEPPIPKDEITAHRALSKVSALRGRQGTNFMLSDTDAAKLFDFIESRSGSGRRTAKRGRPPTWVRDELILALDLYLSDGSLDDIHPKVVALSQVLRGLPLHLAWRDDPKFRNGNSVSMKPANFSALDPTYGGSGLSDTSKGDREVWDELHANPELVKKLAASIREASKEVESALETVEDDEEDEAVEGRLLTRVHRARERNPALVAKRKQQRRSECSGALTCEACGFDFSVTYGSRGDGFAECHHKVPLSESGQTKTRLVDLAILCANCHRMIHIRKPMLTIDELRGILKQQRH